MRAVTLLLLLALAGWAGLRYLPGLLVRPGWTPAELAAVDGPATAWKIASVRDAPAWCRKVLALDGIAFEPVADRAAGGGCGWSGAVQLTGAPWSPRGPVMTCPLAVALTIWERGVVRPAAHVHLRSNLTRIDHYGTYSCRPIAGTARPSEHARANAIDIAGFATQRGAPVSVRADWQSGGDRAAFLRSVQDGGCAIFGTILGPAYNAAHRDHFHFDMANWHYCPGGPGRAVAYSQRR